MIPLAPRCAVCLKPLGSSSDCYSCHAARDPDVAAAVGLKTVSVGGGVVRPKVVILSPEPRPPRPRPPLSPDPEGPFSNDEDYPHHVIMKSDDPEFEWCCHICGTFWLHYDWSEMSRRCYPKRDNDKDADAVALPPRPPPAGMPT